MYNPKAEAKALFKKLAEPCVHDPAEIKNNCSLCWEYEIIQYSRRIRLSAKEESLTSMAGEFTGWLGV